MEELSEIAERDSKKDEKDHEKDARHKRYAIIPLQMIADPTSAQAILSHLTFSS